MEFRLLMQVAQLVASLAFVVLYIWSTYAPPQPGSVRSILDLTLCAVFALEYLFRIAMSDSPVKAAVSPLALIDLLSFLPSLLLEAPLLSATTAAMKAKGMDLRWFRIFRALRLLRLSLLMGNVPRMNLSRGALVSGAVNVRLLQLLASVLALLFTSASVIHIVERLPWHDALYFVTTTLTTVGFGDVVVRTTLGKMAVLVMIAIGVIIIPVRTSQLYQQVISRKVFVGALPNAQRPWVLVSMRLTEVRGFSDLFAEFFHHAQAAPPGTLPGGMPAPCHMVVVANKPAYEFRAFQELNEKRLTVMEGSVLSEGDLQRLGASTCSAALLLADRFTSNAKQEDMDVQFQVWALKAFTKTPPLYVQVLQRAAMEKVTPFLDPTRDVVVSVEATRHRLLALSALTPGASTLIGNLMHGSHYPHRPRHESTLAGRRWLREYVDGCHCQVLEATVGALYAGWAFPRAAAHILLRTGVVLLGVLGRHGSLQLNPSHKLLRAGDRVAVLAASQDIAEGAVNPPLPAPADPADVSGSFTSWQGGAWQWQTGGTQQQGGGSRDEDDEWHWEQPTVGGPQQDERWQQEGYGGSLRPRGHPSQGASGGEDDFDLDLCRKVIGYGMESESLDELDLPENCSLDAIYAAACDEGRGHPADGDLLGAPGRGLDTLRDHIIICGAESAFLPFAEQIRRCEPRGVPLVLLDPKLPAGTFNLLAAGGPVHWVKGTPSDPAALRSARAQYARALVYLGTTQRAAVQEEGAHAADYGSTSRGAVLADAEALLVCYGAGEETLPRMVHAVVELCFTSSVRFLQPGLLLQGASQQEAAAMRTGTPGPRRSWQLRKLQETAAMGEGLSEWQANPYYAAGRVTVPALLDTFTCQSFFKRGLLIDLMTEMAGDDDRPGGAMLRQEAVPPEMIGRTYGELAQRLLGRRRLVPLGLYRRKGENPAWRLSYVAVGVSPREVLLEGDAVFVLRPRSRR